MRVHNQYGSSANRFGEMGQVRDKVNKCSIRIKNQRGTCLLIEMHF
jgi:hypothetical protein